MLAFDQNKILYVNKLTFKEQALQVFQYQAKFNKIYQEYIQMLSIDPEKIQSINEIPFLPVQFFKHHAVTTTGFVPEIVFTSSGTTGQTTSRHLVKDVQLYEKSFTKAFRQFYGDPSHYCILGLLPSYLEREGSSLVYMVEHLIRLSGHPLSDFYLHNHEHLYLILQELEKDKQPTILFGVTFALLDFAAKFKMQLDHVILIETGGMKGRGKEFTRKEVHDILKTQLGVKLVCSEYGMTELLSQAYTTKEGKFECPPWMKILVRAEDDPFLIKESGKGIINIIDLANIYSCSFIATDDLGVVQEDSGFEVIGRLDQADLRGCSLLVL